MKSNYSLLIATLLIFVASNQKQEENKTAESSKNKSAFIFSTWITSKKDKTDDAYTAEFKRYKEGGIDAVLINTSTDQKSWRV